MTPVGRLTCVDHGKIAGWIASTDGGRPRLVDIYLDNRLMRTVRADECNVAPKENGIDLTGYCAFELSINGRALKRLPAQVEVRAKDAATGQELTDSPQFLAGNPGIPPGTPISSARGEPYTINKNGGLSVRFAHRNEAFRGVAVRNTAHLIELLQSFGLGACLAYGSLLGATRNGRLIDHDDDMDIMYIAKATCIESAVAEFMSVLKSIEQAGTKVVLFSLGQARARIERSGLVSAVDVFLSWIDEGGNVHLNFALPGNVQREALLPLEALDLEGIRVPVPRQPEVFCHALYGDNWATPDPLFKWQVGPRTKEILKLVSRPIVEKQLLWNSYYRRNKQDTGYSQFAEFVLPQLNRGDTVVDVGCGRGADAAFFAQHGIKAFGLDYSPLAIAAAKRRQRGSPGAKALFQAFNICDRLHCDAIVEQVRRGANGVALYSRLLPNYLSDIGLAGFSAFCQECVVVGERMFLEFAVSSGPEAEGSVGPSFFRFAVPEKLLESLHASGLHTKVLAQELVPVNFSDTTLTAVRLVLQRQ